MKPYILTMLIAAALVACSDAPENDDTVTTAEAMMEEPAEDDDIVDDITKTLCLEDSHPRLEIPLAPKKKGPRIVLVATPPQSHVFQIPTVADKKPVKVRFVDSTPNESDRRILATIEEDDDESDQYARSPKKVGGYEEEDENGDIRLERHETTKGIQLLCPHRCLKASEQESERRVNAKKKPRF